MVKHTHKPSPRCRELLSVVAELCWFTQQSLYRGGRTLPAYSIKPRGEKLHFHVNLNLSSHHGEIWATSLFSNSGRQEAQRDRIFFSLRRMLAMCYS